MIQRNSLKIQLSAVFLRLLSLLEEKLRYEQRLATLQRNFLAMASHEFRTPLTIIDGHAQRMKKMKAKLQPHHIDERADKIRSAALRMTNVIDSLPTSSRLFERYHRGSNVSGISGTGIGLYLVKMVVSLHGGQVSATSEVERGTEFTVRLPFDDVAAKTPQIGADPPHKFDLGQCGIFILLHSGGTFPVNMFSRAVGLAADHVRIVCVRQSSIKIRHEPFPGIVNSVEKSRRARDIRHSRRLRTRIL